jgi:hypothetical protein
MKNYVLHGLLLFIFSQAPFGVTSAQEKVKFGKIPIEDLQMSRYAADSTAPAIILYDKGYFDATSSRFTRHMRLKIISNAGASYANFAVRTPSKSGIDGSTYNLVNGEIVEAPLEKENIFTEKIVDDLSIYKIFFPNVKPGSVVELRYSFVGLPFEWRFQDRIPVKYNELTLEPTDYITFKKTMFGLLPIENKGLKWIATNMPAFVEEPHMCHYSNYLTHFKFDIESVHIPGVLYREFSTQWAKVGQRLMEDPGFGQILTSTPFLNEKASELKKSTAPIQEKILTAYRYIQENIKWNGSSTPFVTTDFSANFKKNHSGNSAEVNMSLISLLRKCDIKVYPAVLSTRENGLLNPGSASMSSINYVVGYVNMDGVELFVDATDPDLLPGVLPLRCRNINAFVIDAPAGWWVDTSLGKGNSRKQFVSIKQDANGKFVAEVSDTHEDYDYLEWIEHYKEYGSEEAYARAVMAKSRDLEISSCKVTIDKEKLKAIEKRSVQISDTEHAQDLGSEIVINPFVFNDITNPFKQEGRNHPIDFLYPRSRTITISFQIPENYVLRKIPEKFAVAPESGGAKFTYLANLSNNILTVRCTFQVERQMFTEAEYPALRGFFVEVNRKISEAIQLDKKT